MSAAVAAATGSAHGKVILLGEHAVVYGAPALVAGVGQQLCATVRGAADGVSRVRICGSPWQPADAAGDDLQRAFAALLAGAAGKDRQRALAELLAGADAGVAGAVTAEIKGELPAGVGLGFSAAAGVALARAVAKWQHGRAEPDEVLARALAWERVFHGNPSGADTAAALHGGCLRFVKGEGVVPIRPGGTVRLCVGLTGVSSRTREMVAQVAHLRAAEPELVDGGVAAIGRLVDEAAEAIGRGDGPRLGRLMAENQALLARWQLSTPAIETLCTAARQAGALGAKLTGAGGGGAVVALAGIDQPGSDQAAPGPAGEIAAAILAVWQARGYTGFQTTVGQISGADPGPPDSTPGCVAHGA